MKKKWLPWIIVGAVIVVAVGVLLVWNPPFVENIFSGSGSKNNEAGSKVVARVGSSKLTLDEYKSLLALYVPRAQQAQVDPMEVINLWVEQEVVYQQAKKTGLDKKDTIKMALDQLEFAYDMSRKRLLSQAWLEDEAKKITISQSELENYFNAHKDEFTYEVKISQIIVADPISAQNIYQQLKQGADFRKLAEQYTLDSLKGQPSNFIPRGSGFFTLQMEDAIFALKPGQFTEPLSADPAGLTMIFKLEDKQKTRKSVVFSDVAGYLNTMILYERSQQIIARKLDSLKTAAQKDIEIRMDNILY
ncbi:hypothetical protein GX441_09590 [bacterium]|nr:hypothetical protein [bacterium]